MTICTVCSHLARDHIDRALVRGESLASLSRQYGPSVHALGRHRRNCIPAAMWEAMEAEEADSSTDTGSIARGQALLQQAVGVYRRAARMLDELEADRVDARARVAGLREVRQALETLAKLTWAVEDRGGLDREASTAPAIDAAITAALAARGVTVERPDEQHTPQAWREALALPPGPPA